MRNAIARTIASVPLPAGWIATGLAMALFHGSSALGQDPTDTSEPSRSRAEALDTVAPRSTRVTVETQPLGMTGWQPDSKITIETHTLGMTGWLREPITITTPTLSMSGWQRDPVTVETPTVGMVGWQRAPVIVTAQALGLTGWAAPPKQCAAPFVLDGAGEAGEDCVCPPDLLPSGDSCVAADQGSPPDLAVEARRPDDCVAGGICPFNAMLTNVGTGPFRGPVFVEVEAGIPVARVSTSSSGWRCSADACVHPGVTLAPGASATLTVNVAVPANTDRDALRQCVALKAPAPGDAPVRFVQVMLAAAGIDAGPADNQMGQKTRSGIEAFRRSAGLPSGAGIDDALIAALRDLVPIDSSPANDRSCAEARVTR